MKNINIKDWYGSIMRSMTYDETTMQLSGVKVPQTLPGEFVFIFTTSLGGQQTSSLYARYYVNGYVGCGDTQQMLRITYPKGETTYLPDITDNFDIFMLTTNPGQDHFSFNINGNLWHTYYTGSPEKLFISSGTNPTVRLKTNLTNVEYVLPINNRNKIWGLSVNSTTQPDIYADIETNVTIPNGTHMNMIFTTSPTESLFLTLYQNNAASTIVNKTTFLTQVDSLPGILRKQCSVSDPVITIQYTGKPAANYCYIAEFKRYYYINDMVNIAENLWELYLKSDPLYSFKSEYLNSLVTILRSSSSSIYNRMYNDNLMPIPSKLNRQRIYSGTTPFDPDYLTGNDAHFILSTFCDHNMQPISPSYYTPTNGIKGLYRYYPLGASMYIIDTGGVNGLAAVFSQGGPDASDVDPLAPIFGTDDLSPYITSLRAYPINFNNYLDNVHFQSFPLANQKFIPCGKSLLKKHIEGSADRTCSGLPLIPINPVFEFGTITVPTPTSFLDVEPHSKAILHLPYMGDINFDLTEYAGLTIKVEYRLDPYTGNAKALVKNYADGTILITSDGKLGVDVPLILNNMQKGASERTGQAIKLGTSIASVVAGAVGTAAASPVVGGLIGGAVSMVGNTIATPFFNTPNQNKQLAAGDMTDMYTDQDVYLEIIKPDNNFNIFYAQQYGVPANKIINLSDTSVSGFTVVSPNSRITQPVEATLNEYEEICAALKSGVEI